MHIPRMQRVPKKEMERARPKEVAGWLWSLADFLESESLHRKALSEYPPVDDPMPRVLDEEIERIRHEANSIWES